MKNSFIKKIISIEELENVSKDIEILFSEENEKYSHTHDLKHDFNLITKSISHESLLMWNIHLWAHFNGEMWDGIFIGIIRKSEKFNKKTMDEYLWISKNSNSGMKLYKSAYDFANSQNCELIQMSVIENSPVSSKLKKIYKLLGFQKDSETYIKLLK